MQRCFLASQRGFEPPTPRLGGGRSIQLSYGNIFKIYSILVLNLLNVNRLCPKGGRYNIFLGGPRYIHLTKETNAVFPGFFDPLAPAAIIYNSNTFVMNYLFLISSDFQISLP